LFFFKAEAKVAFIKIWIGKGIECAREEGSQERIGNTLFLCRGAEQRLYVDKKY
jgi:hypothetical protein